MEIDQVTLDLVLRRFRQYVMEPLSVLITGVRKDDSCSNGIVYETLRGEVHGTVSQEGNSLIFQFDDLDEQLIIPASDVIGKQN